MVESAAAPNLDAQAFLMTAEGGELAALFPKLRRTRIRRKVVELVRALADVDDDLEPLQLRAIHA